LLLFFRAVHAQDDEFELQCTSDDQFRGWKNQAIGVFLVEYMRTKWNGPGISDINHRHSHMIEIMAKESGFETAFQEEFGVTFDAFRATFIKYLEIPKMNLSRGCNKQCGNKQTLLPLHTVRTNRMHRTSRLSLSTAMTELPCDYLFSAPICCRKSTAGQHMQPSYSYTRTSY